MLEVKKAALLGYGIMSFADLNDMGRGLEIELKNFNCRTPTTAQINALIAAVGGDPKDLSKEPKHLNRFSPDHAMFMVLKPAYLDITTLCKDPFSPEFQQVRWKGEARSSTTADLAYLVNGNTRRELCLRFGEDAISKLNAIKKKITDSKENDAAYQQLIKQRAEAMVQVRRKTSWIVAFFDQGEDL